MSYILENMRAISSAYNKPSINNLADIILAAGELLSNNINDPAITIVARQYLKIINDIDTIKILGKEVVDFYNTELQSLNRRLYLNKLH